MSAPLVVSLFPGLDLLGMAFELEGFCVVRGPEAMLGGDAREFHLPRGVAAGVIGGPPCKKWSRLQALVRHNRRKRQALGLPGYEEADDLIPEFERLVGEAQPEWFLMEQVPRAPVASVPGYAVRDYLRNNRSFGAAQNRVRRFSFGTRDGRPLYIQQETLESIDYLPSVTAAGSTWVPVRVGGNGKNKHGRVYGDKSRPYLVEAMHAQGLPDAVAERLLKHAPFTVKGMIAMVCNGVPIPMGRAIARAVKAAMYSELAERAS